MRRFLYRISWDKQYLKRSLIVGACSLCALGLIAVCVVGTIHIGKYWAMDDEVVEEDIDKGPIYDLFFGDFNHEEIDDNHAEENKEVDQSESGSGSSPYNQNNGNISSDVSSGTEEEPQQQAHVHSWHKVIDSAAWTEYKQVQIGNQYRCNNCGFTCTSASVISSHCSRLSHSFSQSPIYETKTIYHPEVSHLECNCGARQ